MGEAKRRKVLGRGPRGIFNGTPITVYLPTTFLLTDQGEVYFPRKGKSAVLVTDQGIIARVLDEASKIAEAEGKPAGPSLIIKPESSSGIVVPKMVPPRQIPKHASGGGY